MVIADIDEVKPDRVHVRCEYRDKELVTQVPGARWSNADQKWTVPLTYAACLQLRGVFGDRLTIGDKLNAWAWTETNDRVNVCLSLRESDDADELTQSEPDLFPFQRAGVKFLTTAKRAALCDPMGTGKTVQTIRALENLGEDAFPAVIVCPTSMKRTWRDEFAKWAPNRDVVVLEGAAQKRRKTLAEQHDVFIMNWELVMRHSKLAGYGYIKLSDTEKELKELNRLGIRSVVADEAHRAKSPKAKQTRALWAIGKQAEYRFALTGTPIANAPNDLWSIMHFVDPDEWPSKNSFIERYAQQSWNAFGFMDVVGIRGEMREELFKILDPRFLRRPKEIALSQLPPKMPPETRWAQMGTKQAKAYKQLSEDMLAELDSGVLMATNPLTRLTRLLQFAAAYGDINDDGQMRLQEPSCKIDALMDLVEEVGDEQLVVFAESRQLIELAAARMAGEDLQVAQITGAVSQADRDFNRKRFQGGDVQHLLVTLGAGGEGLTLTASSIAVFLQRSYSALKNAQAEDRLHRHGQERPVRIIDIITEDTCEEGVHRAYEEKKGRLQEVVRDKEMLRKWLDQ